MNGRFFGRNDWLPNRPAHVLGYSLLKEGDLPTIYNTSQLAYINSRAPSPFGGWFRAGLVTQSGQRNVNKNMLRNFWELFSLLKKKKKSTRTR